MRVINADLNTDFRLRARVKIKLPFWALRRPPGKARGRRIAGYLTDEKRGQAEWISVQNGKFILTRALSLAAGNYTGLPAFPAMDAGTLAEPL